MASIPSYLHGTAYGERFKVVTRQHSQAEVQDSEVFAGLTNGSSVNGRLPPAKRIYNNTSSKLVNGNGIAAGSHNDQGNSRRVSSVLFPTPEVAARELPFYENVVNPTNTALSVSSTLPLFRDEGLYRSALYVSRILPESGSDALQRHAACDHVMETYDEDDDEEEDDSENDDDYNLDFEEDIKPANEYVAAQRAKAKMAKAKRELTIPSLQPLPPLPDKFVKRYSNQSVDIKSPRVLEALSDIKHSHEIHSLRTEHSIPHLCVVYYYEVEILSCSLDPQISVGFCRDGAQLSKLPGSEGYSWGYHSQDGKRFDCTSPNNAGPTFGAGDIVGCGLNFATSSIFYTKNGVLLDPHTTIYLRNNQRLQDMDFYPCVGFKPSVSIKVNFGEEEFLYDVSHYLKGLKDKLLGTFKISDATATSKATIPESEVPNVVQSLISSYFSYLGYMDTAKAFQEELAQEARLLEDGDDDRIEVDEIEDLDITNRQQIRRLITSGHIEQALDSLKEHYPRVLEGIDSLVVFKLECSKFVELVRAMLPELDVVEMEVDTPVPVQMNGNAIRNGTDATQTAIQYGQTLWGKYKDDKRPQVLSRLSECFSLLAYEDPRQVEGVAHLLDDTELVSLAEDVNSLILVSLGKQSVPPLKRVAQQAMGLVWELQNQGRLDVGVLNVKADFF